MCSFVDRRSLSVDCVCARRSFCVEMGNTQGNVGGGPELQIHKNTCVFDPRANTQQIHSQIHCDTCTPGKVGLRCFDDIEVKPNPKISISVLAAGVDHQVNDAKIKGFR